MLPLGIIDVVAEYLGEQPDVAAAYVFGSAAKGTMRADSDVDVGVLFGRGAGNKVTRFERRLELEMALQDRVHRPVQIIDFRAASLIMQYEIMKSGKRVVDRDPAYRVHRETRALGEYLDFKPTYDFCINAALGRL